MARPRTPTATLEARGAFKKHPERRREREEEPQPDPGAIKPAGMSLEAERVWADAEKTLTDAGVLTRMDAVALAMYCETYAEWRDARDRYSRQPIVYKGRGKYRQQVASPYHAIAASAETRLLKLITEFGMTPASRSKVSGKKKTKDKTNRFADIFSGKKPQPQPETTQ